MKQELRVDVRHDGDASTLALSGHFDYGTAGVFGKAMRECLSRPEREVVVDCGALDYIDSMAMGTLLVYREKLANLGRTLVLANCRGAVRDAMNLANFQKIFQLR